MARYTPYGTGDICQDDKEDNRPICIHCGEKFTHIDTWITCSSRCSILESIGEMKAFIMVLLDGHSDYERTVKHLVLQRWFDGVSEYSVDRWLRAIWARMEYDNAMEKKAIELENYHNGF